MRISTTAATAFAVATTLAFTTLTPHLAAAQPAQPPGQPPVDWTKVAKDYVAAGIAAQKIGDYDTAITLYQKAFDLVPHPVLLFNIAQAHRLANRLPQALDFYKKYVAADPDGAQAKAARELIAEEQPLVDELNRKAAAAKAHDSLQDRQLAELKRAEDARRAAEAKRVADAQGGGAVVQPPPPGPGQGTIAPVETPLPPSPGRTERLAGIALGAGGGIALLVGIGYGVHASSLSDDLSKSGAVFDPKKVSDGHAADRNCAIATVLGALMIGGGVTLYVLGHRAGEGSSTERAITLAPLVLPDGGGFAIGGRLP